MPATPQEARSFRNAMGGFYMLAAVAGVAYFTDPSEAGNAAVRTALPGLLDEGWSTVYAVGGLLATLGLALRRAELERPGITMLLGAMSLNLASIAHLRGLVGALLQAPVYAVAFWVFAYRLRVLEARRRELQRLAYLEANHERRGNGAPDTGERRRA